MDRPKPKETRQPTAAEQAARSPLLRALVARYLKPATPPPASDPASGPAG